MSSRGLRNALPPLYGLLVLVEFLISAAVGLVVLIAGAVVMGVLWSALSGPRERGAARAVPRHSAIPAPAPR
jgi:hypothetical protein